MIDSHTHIYCEAFDDDRDAVVARAREVGVRHIVLPNENLASVERVLAVAERYPQYASPTIGLHPEDINDAWRETLAQMRVMLDARDCWVAIGEIGIDLYWDKTWRDEQMLALDAQLHWCVEKGLPFIIHCREALDEILEVLDGFSGKLPQGVFHSFTGTAADVERIRRRGDFYFGVNGIVTFKKSELPAVLPVIGLDRLLLETDAPYLAPVPHRGKRNEPSFIPDIARCVAQHLGVTIEETSRVTDENAKNLFGFPV